mmetsp:Transcript_8678/g.24223  ORF Transcript_8678/g.24223 Transcript_8678/m.24223 type:complete len:81 (-) Transcript_8678:241-483(-)|eukprot:CAMPEP_0194482056 /NCGR_PEP_ID=MMETSP0253-20130528/4187_1 /TAXON_ID=2966 /ORGANISM="Noctiluca scintillans" /LENGTH=80 /DNA_ID=CAMNT_0039321573 /DNA_START=67 /DNA_END=309 /DNA_ORIENTATION=+
MGSIHPGQCVTLPCHTACHEGEVMRSMEITSLDETQQDKVDVWAFRPAQPILACFSPDFDEDGKTFLALMTNDDPWAPQE